MCIRDRFSCKQSVTKAIWDAKGNRAIGKSKEAKEVNFALDNIKAQIAKHYQRLSYTDFCDHFASISLDNSTI